MHESVKLAPHGYPGSNPGLSTFDKLSALALEIGESSQDEKFTLSEVEGNPGLSTFDKLSALALEIGESSQDEKFTLDLLKTYLFYAQKYK